MKEAFKHLKRYHAYYGIFFASISIILVVSNTTFSYIIHTCINIFAGGRSISKSIAFFVYLFILYAIVILYIHKKPAIRPLASIEKSKKILFFLIGIIFLINIITHLYLTKTYGLNIADYTIVFNNNEISSNQLAHTHVGKGFIAYLLQIIHITKLESVDAGNAYLGLIPNIFYILSALLIFTSLVSILLIFTNEDNKKTDHILFTPLFAMLSFGLIEHTFDGGILDPRTIALLGLFIYFLFYANKKYRKIVFICFTISIILSFLILNILQGSDANTFTKITTSLIAYIGIFFLPIDILYKKINTKNILPYFIFCILLVLPFLIFNYDFSEYRRTTLSGTDSYLALYNRSEPYSTIDTIGPLTIYKLENQNKNVATVLKKYNLLDNIIPITVLFKTCIPNGRREDYKFSLLSKNKLTTFDDFSYFSHAHFTEETQKKNMFLYTGFISIDKCAPRKLNILEEQIKRMGTYTFFITKLNIVGAN